MSFDSGWKAVVCLCEMFSISQSWDQRVEVNCCPRSEVIVLDTPKREIQLKVKSFEQAAVEVFDKGIASIHLDVRSIIVKM